MPDRTEQELEDAMLQALSLSLDSSPPDPSAKAPYPVGLSLDIALQTAPLKDILASYELTPQQAKAIFANPAFRHEYEAHREAMKNEGYSFRRKAQAQAEQYLQLMWRMAHSDQVPAAVRADLIKSTIKYGALDAPAPVSSQNQGAITPEMLAQLREMPGEELELRVMSIISRRAPAKEKIVNEPLTIEGEKL